MSEAKQKKTTQAKEHDTASQDRTGQMRTERNERTENMQTNRQTNKQTNKQTDTQRKERTSKHTRGAESANENKDLVKCHVMLSYIYRVNFLTKLITNESKKGYLSKKEVIKTKGK